MSAQVHQFPTDTSRLATIAKEIQEELATASRNALESAIRIGEMLIEAKKLAGHGNFIPWLETNFTAGERQAQKYISAARNADKLRAKANSEFVFDLNSIPMLLALPDNSEEQEEVVQTAIKEALAGVEKPTKAQVKRAVKKATAKSTEPRDRTGTKTGAAIEALYEAGPDGLGKTETAHAAGLRSPAGLARQVTTNEIVEADNRYYHPAFAPARPMPELSLTAQQKLDTWQKKLEADFDYRVRMAAIKQVEELRIPALEEKIKKLTGMLSWPQFSVMWKAEYNKIVKCLHPDHKNSRTVEELAEAFDIFTHYKLKFVNDDEDRRNTLRQLRSNMPKSLAEMLANKKSKTR